ncbi:SusC/RagA family TonB-linked outer membrane protein [Flavisolibacter nicotianae]|uniref:SusC/RagA family TonB-linked outer membrane protein n=1 Tax=Flavisolibacter nicotianae TaxID=2364882 RepID=UPI000EADB238|nr:TonB-dependent receptor [Flavisolibacter nicotianae]
MRKIKNLLLLGMLCSIQFLWAQTTQITGKVSDENGVPVYGATVSVKNTNISAVTAADGSFTIKAAPNATLQISYVGYRTVEVPASAAASIRLAQGENKLTEVVVTGYGQSSKRELTSSVTKVKGADVVNTPVPNFTQALQGRAAGVFVESQNGKVGEGVKVRIRGQGSINASNSPLYVVDGIPINTGTLSGNALADINFNDVESFDVLKDAAATAIYGSRAANGVILITTKKGRAGKPKFNVNFQYGSNNPTHKRGFLNAQEYLDFFREAAVNAGKYHYNRAGNWAGFGSEQEAVDYMVSKVEGRFTRYSGWSDWKKLETNTNWEDLAFQDAHVGSVDVSAAGGNERTRYYMSGSYNSQDGILFGNNFDRISGRINLDQDLSDKFKVGVNLTVARTNTRRVAEDNDFSTPMQIVALSPITPARDKNGKLYDRPVTTYYNPLIELENGEWRSTNYRNIGAAFGQYNFLKNLYFRTEFGLDMLNQNDEEFYGSQTINGNATNGFGRSTWLRTVRYTTNNFFNYKFNLGSRHDFDATAGYSFEKSQSRSTSVSGEQFPSDDLRTLASAGKITAGSSSKSEFALESFFGRINYKFNDKYLLGVSGRYDGSSVFGVDKRYGFFPAASAGWIISQENFLKSSNVLNFLKLRGSYGQLGNSLGFGNYEAQPAFGVAKYAGVSVLSPARLGNNQLTWETSNQLDLGLEFGIFNNRLSGEFDFYDKRSAKGGRGFIFNLPVPLTTGYGSFITNIGEIQNKGIEIALNSTNINGRDFRWTTSFNFTYNQNKVLKIDGEQDTLSFNDGRYMNALIVGQPIGVFYGPRYAGVDPQNGDALYYEQDGKTTTNDYNAAGSFVVGNPNPKYFGGINNSFSYKGIELNVLFQGVFDYQIVNGAGGFMSARGDWFDNQTRDQLKRWQKPGDVTNVPQARLNWFGDFASPSVSTQYMESGSYVRLKNVTLAYNLPANILRKAKLSSARVYATGVNLATFTNYSGWDPEVNTDYRASNINQGSDFYAAPQIKSFVVGLNIGF